MALPGNGYGESPEQDEDGRFETEEQLALAQADDRLPWLESDDDYEQPGVDTGRIIAFAAVGLLAIVVLVGTLYMVTRGAGEAELVADGSTIEAPDEPYKTRPDDPGGRQVEGTGDASFEVAEGQSVEGRIAAESTTAAAVRHDDPSTPVATASPERPPAVAEGIGVQVGAYSNRAQAEAGWNLLVTRFDVLQGHNHRVLEGVADSGTIYRLQALAGSVAEAEALCRGIKASGGDCQVKR